MVHVACVDEPGRTLMLHVIRVTISGSKPLVLDGSALRLVVVGGSLLLFLVVHVLVLKIAQEWLLGLAIVQLLRGGIRFCEITNLLIVRNDDSFGLELRRAFHCDALIGGVHLQLLARVNLCAHLGLNVRFVVDRVAQVTDLVRWLQVAWHRHLRRNALRATEAVQHVVLFVLV